MKTNINSAKQNEIQKAYSGLDLKLLLRQKQTKISFYQQQTGKDSNKYRVKPRKATAN